MERCSYARHKEQMKKKKSRIKALYLFNSLFQTQLHISKSAAFILHVNHHILQRILPELRREKKKSKKNL